MLAVPASGHPNPAPPKALGVGDRSLALIQRCCLSACEKPGVRKRQSSLYLWQLKTISPRGTAVSPGGLEGDPLSCSRGFRGTECPGTMQAHLQTSDCTNIFVLFPHQLHIEPGGVFAGLPRGPA